MDNAFDNYKKGKKNRVVKPVLKVWRRRRKITYFILHKWGTNKICPRLIRNEFVKKISTVTDSLEKCKVNKKNMNKVIGTKYNTVNVYINFSTHRHIYRERGREGEREYNYLLNIWTKRLVCCHFWNLKNFYQSTFLYWNSRVLF